MSIPAEELVGPLTIEQHRYAGLPGDAVHAPLRVDARRANRLLVVANQAGKVAEQISRRRFDHVVAGDPRGARDLVGVDPLVAFEVRETGRERVPAVLN